MTASVNKIVYAVGILLLIDFAITITILFTDKNLQTDFGVVKPYFIHWYGLLITGIVDIIGAGIIFARPTGRNSAIAAVGTALLAVFLIADIATYSMVGFTSASSFATYLFGFSKFKGSLPYIPGLYDVLFAFYIVTSGVAFALHRK
ncbi:MAG: hypothetical protein AAE976_05840 [Thermoplasmataceae archaeon]|jgi:hypothetical protein